MKFAAINNRLFHIWFHPHNFGVNTQKNINYLLEIILYFKYLEKRYNMKSMNMRELSLFNGENKLSKRIDEIL